MVIDLTVFSGKCFQFSTTYYSSQVAVSAMIRLRSAWDYSPVGATDRLALYITATRSYLLKVSPFSSHMGPWSGADLRFHNSLRPGTSLHCNSTDRGFRASASRAVCLFTPPSFADRPTQFAYTGGMALAELTCVIE